MSVVTRFAPSPTGVLHVGGARTALFNWLQARRAGGRFLLRVEDTDRERSTPEAVDAILDGLAWLGLGWDGDPVRQSARSARHREIGRLLLERGHAYRCYCAPEKLAAMRDAARAEKRQPRYDGTCRDRSPSEAPAGVAPAIRFRAPREGVTVIDDAVQGRVEVRNDELDDLVMLRADGSPTYMLSVVVDDHDMGVTHVIRGDDHLTNAFRQSRILQALGWTPPAYAHLPLIHGPDGARLSKRHGAVGIEAYREAGILPEAMLNYLCRLGWSHGDDEIFSMDQAAGWFDVADVNKGAARFDPGRLRSLNGRYVAAADDRRLAALVLPGIEKRLGRPPSGEVGPRLARGMASLKPRAKTVQELVEGAMIYAADRPLTPTAKAARLLDDAARRRLAALRRLLAEVDPWSEDGIEEATRGHARAEAVGLGDIAQPLRAALTGRSVSPGVFEVATVLGRDEALGRIGDAAAGAGRAGV